MQRTETCHPAPFFLVRQEEADTSGSSGKGDEEAIRTREGQLLESIQRTYIYIYDYICTVYTIYIMYYALCMYPDSTCTKQ